MNTARILHWGGVGLGIWIAAAVAAPGVEWTNSYPRALQAAQAQQRFLLVEFISDNCTWCRKLEQELSADQAATAALQPFICVKVDVERDQQTAAAFRINGIPRLIVINPEGRIAGDWIGYLAPPDFVAFLADARVPVTDPRALNEAPGLAHQQDLEAVRAATATQTQAVAFSGAFLEYLGNSDPQIRDEAAKRVKADGQLYLPHLLEALGHDYLGVRIAAWQLLGTLIDQPILFDPWAPAGEREKMRRALAEELNPPAAGGRKLTAP